MEWPILTGNRSGLNPWAANQLWVPNQKGDGFITMRRPAPPSNGLTVVDVPCL